MQATEHGTGAGLSRRQMLRAGAAAMAGGFAAKSVFAQSDMRARKRPNILFIMDDQHRGDCIGADGNRAIRTPNLDSLASEGALFRRAYTSLPSCTPARATLLTGQSPWGHGMLGYGTVAERYPVEKPRILREAGYFTMSIGKNHFSPQRNTHGYHRCILDESSRVQSEGFRSDYRSWLAAVDPLADPDATGIGFNDYRAKAYVHPDHYHPTHWTASTACNFLEHYDGQEPFFLKVSFARPHSPYDPPQRFMDAYEDADLPRASVGKWSADWYGQHRSPDPFDLYWGNLGAAQVRHSRQGYYGSISFIDEQVGRIVDTLKRRGMLENTLILFTSDHGDMTGDHHLWRKCYAYEASARIPMIVRWPEGWTDGKRGVKLSQPVELRDILPTILDMAGIAIPSSVEGDSMLKLVRGETQGWRDYIDLEHATCYFRENQWNALTDGHHKYIYHAVNGVHQLFNIDNDPGEQNDLASDPAHAAELRKWQNRMIEHLQIRGDRWVKSGNLALRANTIRYGPNFPGAQS